MISYIWLFIVAVVSIYASYFYTNFRVNMVLEQNDEIIDTLYSQNQIIIQMREERLELIETILPPTETGLH